MKHTHKFSAIKGAGAMSRVHTVTFVSECAEYGPALLSMIKHSPEFHDCFIFEPITRSPVTFDISLRMKGPYNSDRYFLTFNNLVSFCDTIETDQDVIKILRQPFCRVLFSNAGKLGEFLNQNSDKKWPTYSDQKHDSIFWGNDFASYNLSTFEAIRDGLLATREIDGFIFDQVGNLIAKPFYYTRNELCVVYGRLIHDGEYISASRIDRLIQAGLHS